MRTILFRAKTINTGEWVESMTISKGTIKRKSGNYYLELSENNWVGVVEETIGEFTGIINNKGKKIFEGDILYRKSTSTKGKVVFDSGKFIIKWKGEAGYVMFDSEIETAYDDEIIGNVYQEENLLN